MTSGHRDERGCAAQLKSLADGTRLAVVRALMDGAYHVGELAQLLDVEQSLLSHHLQILRSGGLVRATREGKSVRYDLAPGVRPTHRGEAISLGCCELRFDSNAL